MEASNKSGSSGRIVLGLAAAILVVAVAYTLLRGRAAVPPLTSTAVARPADAETWRAAGEKQFGDEHFTEAAASYEQATRLAPDHADLWSALGEALVMASAHDPMPPPALAAFRKAVAINPRDPRGRYFLAVARDLSGDHKGAIDDWFALLAETPPGAVWEKDLRRTIEQVGRINSIDVATRLAAMKPAGAHPAMPSLPVAGAAIPGPTPEEMRAAAALPPSQQDAMAQGMVSRLEAKLKADPGNVDGWVMLMRSRMTLHESAKASAALRDAIAANPGAKTRLENEAATLGVPR